MKNLSKALQPYNQAQFADIEVTPNVFSVKICEANAESQQYTARVSEYAKFCKADHPMFSTVAETRNAFFTDLSAGTVTRDTLEFLLNVIIVDWSLVDDDGETVPYTDETALEVLSTFPRVASKLLRASLNGDTFQQEWTQNALKN